MSKIEEDKNIYNDSDRINWFEQNPEQMFCDKSKEQARFSADGGETWHNDIRKAIDIALDGSKTH